jgi:predicted lipoprotein with Yx(FWY)xxD motif
MKRIVVAVTLAAAFVLSGALPGFSQDATLTVQNSAEHGAYIADAEGRALYLFEADTQGQGGAGAMSTCKDDCAAAWPPLTGAGTTQVSEGVSGEMIGNIQREDGTTQVTYNGWPLYYYAKDQAPGDTTGHDIEDFGAEWYLLTPEGEKAED